MSGIAADLIALSTFSRPKPKLSIVAPADTLSLNLPPGIFSASGARPSQIRWSACRPPPMIPSVLPRSAETDAFWRAFRRYAGLDHDNYVVGSFGDTPEMTTELADLVVEGIKRATASLPRDYGAGEPAPKPGDFVIMLDGKGQPRFIWRTTDVTIKPLSQVDGHLLGTKGRGPRARVVARRLPSLFRPASGAGRVRAIRRDPHCVRALRGRVAAQSRRYQEVMWPDCIAPGAIAAERIMATVFPGSSQSSRDKAESGALRRLGTVEDCANGLSFWRPTHPTMCPER
jgi:uncharacterized protein YhfF